MSQDALPPWVLLGFGPDGWGAALLIGCGWTLALSLASMALGAVLGAGLAGARASGHWLLAGFARVYGVILRGVPELLVVVLIAYTAPGLMAELATAMGLPAPGSPPPFLAGTVALGLVSAAYQAEVFRGGLLALPRGQIEAALAAGMGPWTRARRVILPQVFARVLPPLGNIWQFNLKDSALVAVTGMSELMRTSLVAAGSTRQPFLFFTAAALLYLALTTLSSAAFGWAEARQRRWTVR